MAIEVGTSYQITDKIKGYYNSATGMRIIRVNGGTVQFMLDGGKGHGSMPLQHLQYLLRKQELSEVPNKKKFVDQAETEAELG